MSYGLMVYAVDLNRVGGVAGSNDEALVQTLARHFEGELEDADAYFEDQIAEGAPTRLEALRQLVMGEELGVHDGFQYAYTLKMLVQYFGLELPNGSFYPFRGEWLEMVDAALEGLGVTAFKTQNLQFGSTPFRFPPPDDFPGTGSVSAEAVRQAWAQVQAAPDSALPEDPHLRQAVLEVRGWLEVAAGRGEGLAGFYH